jgi:hypothetical protein
MQGKIRLFLAYVVVNAVSEVEHGVVREEGKRHMLSHGCTKKLIKKQDEIQRSIRKAEKKK